MDDNGAQGQHVSSSWDSTEHVRIPTVNSVITGCLATQENCTLHRVWKHLSFSTSVSSLMCPPSSLAPTLCTHMTDMLVLPLCLGRPKTSSTQWTVSGNNACQFGPKALSCWKKVFQGSYFLLPQLAMLRRVCPGGKKLQSEPGWTSGMHHVNEK